jgi:hypothetical protein
LYRVGAASGMLQFVLAADITWSGARHSAFAPVEEDLKQLGDYRRPRSRQLSMTPTCSPRAGWRVDDDGCRQ